MASKRGLTNCNLSSCWPSLEKSLIINSLLPPGGRPAAKSYGWLTLNSRQTSSAHQVRLSRVANSPFRPLAAATQFITRPADARPLPNGRFQSPSYAKSSAPFEDSRASFVPRLRPFNKCRCIGSDWRRVCFATMSRFSADVEKWLAYDRVSSMGFVGNLTRRCDFGPPS